MQEITFKLNRKITGIRSAASNRLHDDELLDNDFDQRDKSVTLKGSEFKALQDRIKVLESELQRTREESFQAGYAEGKNQGIAESAEYIKELHVKFEEQEKAFHLSLEKLDEPVLQLAIDIAEKVVGSVVRQHENIAEILQTELSRMLHEVIDQNKIVIALNPGDLKRIELASLRENLEIPESTEFKFISDQNLQSGECLIRTEGFHLDGTHKNQLENIRQKLAGDDRV